MIPIHSLRESSTGNIALSRHLPERKSRRFWMRTWHRVRETDLALGVSYGNLWTNMPNLNGYGVSQAIRVQRNPNGPFFAEDSGGRVPTDGEKNMFFVALFQRIKMIKCVAGLYPCVISLKPWKFTETSNSCPFSGTADANHPEARPTLRLSNNGKHLTNSSPASDQSCPRWHVIKSSYSKIM